MRQCIFVVGTRAELVEIAPVLRLASTSRLRHTVWFTAQDNESIDDLVTDLEISSVFVRSSNAWGRNNVGRVLLWLPSTLYRCFRYVGGVKMWTTRRPLVVVIGDTLSSWVGAQAGSWGGGDVVHLQSGLSAGKSPDSFPRKMFHRLTSRNARFALCPSAEAAERMQRYSGCIVVNIHEKASQDRVPATEASVDALLRWAGAEQSVA